MEKAFSVASWNVEHFGAVSRRTNKPERPIQPIIEFLAQQDADIVVIYEVRSRDVYRPVLEKMPGYQFHITEGPQVQEILVGVKHGISAFITQRLEFKSGQATLRPGVLLTALIDGEYYPILILHLKSMTDPKGFGLRDDMLRRAIKFRGNLDKISNGPKGANYIIVGDLNTMGLDYPYSQHDISADDEIKELDRRAKYRRMRRLTSSAPYSWWNGSDKYKPGGKLDHVYAADHLKFNLNSGNEVDVRGWQEKNTDTERRAWIDTYSDHGLLYFEVQKV